MSIRLALVTVLIAGAFVTSKASAREVKYQSARIQSIEALSASLPLTLPGGHQINVPVPFGYKIELRQGDVVYIGARQKQRYAGEWRTGDEVQFRLHRNRLYLRRPNGRELRLAFVLRANIGADGKLTNVVRTTR